jgi:hypothetical protein
MLEDLAEEAGHMRVLLEQLNEQIEPENLDRFRLSGLLADIFLSYERMKASLMIAWDAYVRSLPSQNLLAVFVNIMGNRLARDPIDADLSARLGKITDARYYVSKPEHYDDRTLKRVLYELIGATERWVALVEKAVPRPQSKPAGQEKAQGPG